MDAMGFSFFFKLKKTIVQRNRFSLISVWFHKWLYQPFEVGVSSEKLGLDEKRLLSKASYLDKSLEKKDGRLELNEHHFLLSRSAKSLKVWMT